MSMNIFGLFILLLFVNHSKATFFCDFDQNQCDIVVDSSEELDWKRYSERQLPLTGPDADLSGDGLFWFMDANFANNGDLARSRTPVLPGGNCSTVSFYYYLYGADIGTLNLYLTQSSAPYYSDNPIWSLSGNQGDSWKLAEVTISYPVDFTLTFEGVARFVLLDNKGDMGIDNVTVTLGTCDYDHCDPQTNWCQNGGTCAPINSTTYVCECVPGWHGVHCELEVDDCLAFPCNNGSCVDGLNSYQCFCDLGYHGTNCEYINQCVSNDLNRCANGATCTPYGDDYNCTCSPGYSGEFCDTNTNDCFPGTCVNNGVCQDLTDDFTCTCTDDFVGKRCEFVRGGCDFDDGLDFCGYSVDRNVDFLWFIQTGTTPNFNTGPDGDHTTGQGFYMFADAFLSTRTEVGVLYTPMLPDAVQHSCTTLTFWYWMDGDNSIGTLSVYVSTTGSYNRDMVPMWSKSGDQGAGWQEAKVEISAEDVYMLIFEVEAVTTVIYNGDIAIDDITIGLDSCKYNHCTVNPCQNGGSCVEDDLQNFICVCTDQWTGKTCTEDIDQCLSNPCQNNGICSDAYQSFICTCTSDFVGRYCEYFKGSCDFEDFQDPTCSYTDDLTADFTWTRLSGGSPTVGTGPTLDHTTGTMTGFYLYTEATDTVKGETARVVTPVVSGSGGSCSELSFWYHMYGNSIGQLAVYLDYGEVLTNPIWSKPRGGRNEWVNVAFNISFPQDFALVFEAVMDAKSLITADNQGDIAIDDIVVTPNVQCPYDTCFTEPCLNGGTCVAESESDYSCICTSDWSGKNCDQYQQCNPNPCLNNGVCLIGGDGNFECLCPPEFLGNTCEIVNFCEPDPCSNGATCLSSTTFECICPIGFEGLTCAENPDNCANKPCKNGGACTDGLGDYTCFCQYPYYGKDCTTMPSSCDIETDICGWDTDPKSHFEWRRETGAGSNYPITGPRTDHTYENRDEGYYLYTLLYRDDPSDGELYRIRSPLISFDNFGPNVHFELYYHMSGSGVGYFRIYVEENGVESKIFEMSGDQKDRWNYFGYDVAVGSDWRIIVEHQIVFTLFLFGDIAIDDMRFSSIQDSQTTTEPVTTTLPATTTLPVITTQPVTTIPTTQEMTPVVTTSASISTSKTVMVTKTTDKTTVKATPTSTPLPTSVAAVDPNQGLSGGAVAGIVIGILAGIAVLVGVVLLLSGVRVNQAESRPMTYNKDFGVNQQYESTPGIPNPTYDL